MIQKPYLVTFLICIFTLQGFNCQKTEKNQPTLPSLARGRVIYQTQCIACHNANPRQPGSLGPDVFGSTKDLLIARILKGEYPIGYQPKRKSHVMVALPHLQNEIDSIYLFLNTP